MLSAMMLPNNEYTAAAYPGYLITFQENSPRVT